MKLIILSAISIISVTQLLDYKAKVNKIPMIEALQTPTKISATEIIKEYDSNEIQCAAALVYTEARGETIQGQQAVLQVALNRTQDNKSRWSYSICGVVTDSHQFEGIINHGMNPAKTKAEKKQFQTIKNHVADWIVFGFNNPIGNSNHYHATWMEKYPAWSKSMKKIKISGKHIFYAAL